MKILVVDDVGYMRHLLVRLLERNGHSAISAASGEEAYKILEHDHSIGAVLTDLLLGGMDGIDLFSHAQTIERLTDDGNSDAPPFILLTALRPDDNSRSAEAQRLRQAEKMGFEDILLKPVDQKRLIRKLKQIEDRIGGAPIEKSVAKIEKTLAEVAESASDNPSSEALLSTLSHLESELASLRKQVADSKEDETSNSQT